MRDFSFPFFFEPLKSFANLWKHKIEFAILSNVICRFIGQLSNCFFTTVGGCVAKTITRIASMQFIIYY